LESINDNNAPGSNSVQLENKQDRIESGVEEDQVRVSEGEKPYQNLISNLINRIRAAFKIRIGGLQVNGDPVNIGTNEQAASESSPLSVGLPETLEKSVEQYFNEIGEKLRERRALLSLTYEEIERHTHIRTPFLKAMENGMHDQLPSPVQTRGLLAAIAKNIPSLRVLKQLYA